MYISEVCESLNDTKIVVLSTITNIVHNTALRVWNNIQFKYVSCTVLSQLYNYK